MPRSVDSRSGQPRGVDSAMQHGLGPELIAGQRGVVVWLTGLSGAGKTTIAHAAQVALRRVGRTVFVLDGDELRKTLCSDLGFSPTDRNENLRRASEVAALMADAGLIVIAAFITPEHAQRERARALIGARRFLEVFVRTSLATCERRDPKGLYARVRAGSIPEFTGIGSRYEEPTNPDLVLATEDRSAVECASRLVEILIQRGDLTMASAVPPELG